MKTMIDKMRSDWAVVVEERRASGEWTEADEADVGAAVKVAIESGKADLIACWARWLSDMASTTIALKAITLNINARMLHQARKSRAENETKEEA